MNPYHSILELKKEICTPAQEAIRAAFLQMHSRVPLDEINVKQLCQRAHVARTTFYANYQNTNDLLEKIEDGLITDLLKVNDQQAGKEAGCEREFRYTQNLLCFVEANRFALTVLLVNQPDVRLIQKWKTAVKYHFWETLYELANTGDNGLALEMIASMAVGAYTYVLQEPNAIPPQEISLKITKALHSIGG